MFKPQRISFAAGLALLSALATLTGCGFFPPLPPPCTTDCTSSTNFMYVANSTNTTASPASVAGFSLTTTTVAATTTTPASSTLTLAVTPSSPYTLGSYVPTAMAIAPGNQIMYVATTSGVYLYAINSDGSLTLQNNSTPVASILPQAMKVDSTGKYLIVLNLNIAGANASMAVYSIASNTGLLTAVGNPLSLAQTGAASRMTIAPNNTSVYVTLSGSGTDALTFNSTTGALAYVGNIKTTSTAGAAQSVTTDPNSKYAFVTETGGTGVRMFTINADSTLSQLGSPYPAGTGPAGVLVDSTSTYVYVTDRTLNQVHGYTLSAKYGTLTEISSSPFSTGATPVDLVEDASHTYVGVVCNGGGQDLEVYSFDTTVQGALDPAANATTGTDPTLPIAIVATQ